MPVKLPAAEFAAAPFGVALSLADLPPPQHRQDPGQQSPRAEQLRDVVVGSQPNPLTRSISSRRLLEDGKECDAFALERMAAPYNNVVAVKPGNTDGQDIVAAYKSPAFKTAIRADRFMMDLRCPIISIDAEQHRRGVVKSNAAFIVEVHVRSGKAVTQEAD